MTHTGMMKQTLSSFLSEVKKSVNFSTALVHSDNQKMFFLKTGGWICWSLARARSAAGWRDLDKLFPCKNFTTYCRENIQWRSNKNRAIKWWKRKPVAWFEIPATYLGEELEIKGIEMGCFISWLFMLWISISLQVSQEVDGAQRKIHFQYHIVERL